ncbi:MAG: c-type cytochrome [Hyphomicrobium sp.]
MRGGGTLAIMLAAAMLAPAPTMAEDDRSRLAYGRHLSQECTTCHGADAAQGKESGIPRIAGRPASEITQALKAFRSGERSNPVMVSVARSLDEAQIAALAAYFSSLGAAEK